MQRHSNKQKARVPPKIQKKRALTTMVTAIYDNYDNVSQKAEYGF